MGHTPGPWRIGDAGHTVFGPPNGSPSPRTVATVVPHNDRRDNARLIAAAPEMKQALGDLLEWATLMGGWDSPAWERAQQAYNKAEGR
jgi:hypothetical protein